MKFVFITYIAVALGLFIWFLFTSEYFADCEFNDGSCTATVAEYSFKAMVWPAYALR